MKFHKRIIAASCITVVVLSFAVLSLQSKRQNVDEPDRQPTDISAEQAGYCVKSHNGKIAVFIDGEVEPIHTLDSPYVRDLPEYDRKLLETGITADSNAELLKILEDYDN